MNNRAAQIVDIGDGTRENCFVVSENGEELFKIHYPDSVIRKFFETQHGYLLFFHSKALVSKEKSCLCLCSFDGRIKWWGDDGEGYQKGYFGVHMDGDSIIAYDGEYNCKIDPETGKVVDREFFK